MIGAFAYGWPLTKDPIAGVQPIEYMLDLPTTQPANDPTPSSAPRQRRHEADARGPTNGRSLGRCDDAVLLPGMKKAPPATFRWQVASA